MFHCTVFERCCEVPCTLFISLLDIYIIGMVTFVRVGRIPGPHIVTSFFPNLSIFVGVVTVEDGVHKLSKFDDLMQGMKCSSHYELMRDE
jgi:hypothetical protein